MIPCFAINDIKTPKGFLLRGLWFGPKKPKRVVIWVHGLGSSAFTKLELVKLLATKGTAVLAFNNRGFERVASVKQQIGKQTKWHTIGAAHEKFTDCVDDIQGAIEFVRSMRVKDIYLAGHSTGCQKSIYWAYKKKGKDVKGIILLAPVSDYAGAIAKYGRTKVENVAREAERLVARGKGSELLPNWMWEEEPNDAQRFLSLYTPDSVEEIFPYAQPGKKPTAFKAVKKPILVLWAESDEFADRSAKDAAEWFDQNIESKHKVVIVPNVKHNFKGAEREVAKTIREFIS